MAICYAIRIIVINETNTLDIVDLYEKWEKLNCIFVMLIKTTISAAIWGFIDQHDNVRIH